MNKNNSHGGKCKLSGVNGRAECIYCGDSDSFSREHSLPKGFGRFHGYDTLRNSICVTCNNGFKELEGQLLRTGPIGLYRHLVNLGYNRRSDHTNIFRGRSYGHDPPEIPYKSSELRWELLVEFLPGEIGVTIANQVILRRSNGEYQPLPIPDNMVQPEAFAVYVERRGLRDARFTAFYARESDTERCRRLVEGCFGRQRLRPAPQEQFGTTASGEIILSMGKDSCRAIAKIGFHYAVQCFPNIRGHEVEFSQVREFIQNGIGETDDFVKWRKPIAKEFTEGALPDKWRHLLVTIQNEGKISTVIQFYAGPEFIGPCFVVELGLCPSKILLPDPRKGHEFVYDDEGSPHGYDGFMKAIPGLCL